MGPALPNNSKSSTFSLTLRYTKEMLSRPRPELVASADGSSSIVLEDFKSLSSPKLQLLQKKSLQPLAETGQGPGTSIGFFEQGIMVGALFIALPVISAIGYSGWFFMRMVILPNMTGIAWAFGNIHPLSGGICDTLMQIVLLAYFWMYQYSKIIILVLILWIYFLFKKFDSVSAKMTIHSYQKSN